MPRSSSPSPSISSSSSFASSLSSLNFLNPTYMSRIHSSNVTSSSSSTYSSSSYSSSYRSWSPFCQDGLRLHPDDTEIGYNPIHEYFYYPLLDQIFDTYFPTLTYATWHLKILKTTIESSHFYPYLPYPIYEFTIHATNIFPLDNVSIRIPSSYFQHCQLP